MEVRVLGCSGGIGDGSYTSAYLVDGETLLDCGTGVTRLSLGALRRIRHIFLTHAHLDHFVALPFLLAVRCNEQQGAPVVVHATAEAIRLLQANVFNNQIWPDFTTIPTLEAPGLRFAVMEAGETVQLPNGSVTAHPACHTPSSISFALDNGEAQLFYSGDTVASPGVLAAINAQPNLRHLIVETTFPDRQADLAAASYHLCPSMLAALVADIRSSPTIHVTHNKPGYGNEIMSEVTALLPQRDIRQLQTDQTIVF